MNIKNKLFLTILSMLLSIVLICQPLLVASSVLIKPHVAHISPQGATSCILSSYNIRRMYYRPAISWQTAKIALGLFGVTCAFMGVRWYIQRKQKKIDQSFHDSMSPEVEDPLDKDNPAMWQLQELPSPPWQRKLDLQFTLLKKDIQELVRLQKQVESLFRDNYEHYNDTRKDWQPTRKLIVDIESLYKRCETRLTCNPNLYEKCKEFFSSTSLASFEKDRETWNIFFARPSIYAASGISFRYHCTTWMEKREFFSREDIDRLCQPKKPIPQRIEESEWTVSWTGEIRRKTKKFKPSPC